MPFTPYLQRLRDLLPGSWIFDFTRGADAADGILRVAAPDGSSAELLVELERRFSARQAAELARRIGTRRLQPQTSGALLLSRFVSPTARERLCDAGISYLDLTGNAWIRIDQPAVFIERVGAQTDPDPPRRGLRSLKGPKAARILRGLCDWRPPVGVRELARRSGADPGYVSRVLSLLESEDVVVRGAGGGVEDADWRGIVRRWAQDYSVADTNRALPYLAARGIPTVLDLLKSAPWPTALTGAFAVPREARVVPGRVLSLYVTAAESAAEDLGLRETDTGADVLLLEPFDDIVFERTRQVEGTTAVALPQCAVDLLTGTGREPAQADALLSWMSDNEDAWRA